MKKSIASIVKGALAGIACAAVLAGGAAVAYADEAQGYTLQDGTLTITAETDSYDPANGVFAPWFNERGSIEHVVIADGVKGIGDGAFYDCGNLKDAKVPADLETIGAGAFENCWQFGSLSYAGSESVAAPENTAVFSSSVKTIGRDAFYGCNGVQNVYFTGSDFSGYDYDVCGDHEGFRYDFANPYAATIHVPGTVDLEATLASNESLRSWVEESGANRNPVVADIAVTGYGLVTLPEAAWNGVVTADRNAALPGETVTLTPAPAYEHDLESISVASGEAAVELTSNNDGTYSFVMPAGDVAVSVRFSDMTVAEKLAEAKAAYARACEEATRQQILAEEEAQRAAEDAARQAEQMAAAEAAAQPSDTISF